MFLELRVSALKVYQAFCCEGLARVDFLMKKDGSFVVNEINTLPGFTAFSMYPKLFEYAGISVSDVLSELIRLIYDFVLGASVFCVKMCDLFYES
ncbi:MULTISPECIES: hypothetical protein [unclassified Myroides]|uniref:hypothetical protein n=1 Tax=unclassified Myroides TaxID=2642485 RepID=UPI0025777FA2|nr:MULTISPECIES: hypothetical protein [unclassified Myroides]